MTNRKYLKESIKLGNGELTVETGKVAKQADGSVIVQYGDTMILVTAVSARTIALDSSTGRVYLPSATLAPAVGEERPKPIPGSFRVLVVAP